MKVTDRFAAIKTDLMPISLIRNSDFGAYFCTPENAFVFAGIGVDGIHFCILPNEGDMTLENSPVYVVNPMMPDHYAEAVAENFYDFLSLVVTTKDAGAMECISYMNKDEFMKYLMDIPENNDEINRAVSALQKEFNLREINDVYAYVKEVQEKSNPKNIKFSNDFYDAGGPTEWSF